MAIGSQEYVETIPANGDITFGISGDFVRITTTSSPLVLSVHGARSTVKTGTKKRFDPFDKIRFVNATGSPISLTYVAGFGDIDEGEVIGSFTSTPGGTLTTAPDVTVQPMSAPIIILAAAATRKSAIVTNRAASSSIMRIGDVNIGVARGIILQPGQTAELETSAEIRAFNPGTAAKIVAVAEIST